MRRIGLVLMAVILLAACDLLGTDAATGEPPDCEAVGAQIERLCGVFTAVWAAKTRQECETIGMSASDRRCVMRASSCDENTLGRCNVHDRTWGCETDDDECPPGLTCDADEMECVACNGDDDCEVGRFCLDGWCLDDTAEHRSLQNLFDRP